MSDRYDVDIPDYEPATFRDNGEPISEYEVCDRLNQLEELRVIAARLRASIGYAYVSEQAVFAFIGAWDKVVKQAQKSPGV